MKTHEQQNEHHQSCIQACLACAVACERCFAACLKEPDMQAMAGCMANDVECAQTCRYAASAMARDSAHVKAICALCSAVCRACEKECGQHHMAHCQACAKACGICAAECEAMA
jgi:hypothetical protein